MRGEQPEQLVGSMQLVGVHERVVEHDPERSGRLDLAGEPDPQLGPVNRSPFRRANQSTRIGSSSSRSWSSGAALASRERTWNPRSARQAAVVAVQRFQGGVKIGGSTGPRSLERSRPSSTSRRWSGPGRLGPNSHLRPVGS